MIKNILMLALLVLFLVGGYFLLAPHIISTSRIPSWKTYSDSQVTFMYPSDLVINGKTITSSSQKIKITVASGDSSLMNECMKRDSADDLIYYSVIKFSRDNSGVMCGGGDVKQQEIWIVPYTSVYSPGVSLKFSLDDGDQVQQVYSKILSTIKFTK